MNIATLTKTERRRDRCARPGIRTFLLVLALAVLAMTPISPAPARIISDLDDPRTADSNPDSNPLSALNLQRGGGNPGFSQSAWMARVDKHLLALRPMLFDDRTTVYWRILNAPPTGFRGSGALFDQIAGDNRGGGNRPPSTGARNSRNPLIGLVPRQPEAEPDDQTSRSRKPDPRTSLQKKSGGERALDLINQIEDPNLRAAVISMVGPDIDENGDISFSPLGMEYFDLLEQMSQTGEMSLTYVSQDWAGGPGNCNAPGSSHDSAVDSGACRGKAGKSEQLLKILKFFVLIINIATSPWTIAAVTLSIAFWLAYKISARSRTRIKFEIRDMDS